MWSIVAKVLTDHWKPAGLVIVALGFIWLGYKTNDFTIAALEPYFFSEAQAQSLQKRLDDVEKKVDDLSESSNLREASRIESEIFRFRVESCMQPPGPLRTSFENQVAKLISEWRIVTRQAGATPPLPSCQELGQ